MPRYIDWYLAGKLKLDELVSGTMPLDDINEGFADAGLRRGRPPARHLRPLIVRPMDAAPQQVSLDQARAHLATRCGEVEDLRSLSGGFWSSAYSFTHAGQELVARFGARRDWFEADRDTVAFASPRMPVPEVIDIGEAFGGAYAISIRCHGSNLEDVRPDQSDEAGPLLASLLVALADTPKHADLPVGWHWRPPRSDLTWRGWLLERLVDDPSQPTHGWSAALAAQPALDRVHRAGEARLRGLIDACPERRDLVHGDLLHANVLIADDASPR